MTVACPCCGYKTLLAREGYELCPVCFWEDQPHRLPWQVSDANGMSLIQWQQTCLRRGLGWANPSHTRSPRAEEERDKGWAPIPVTGEVKRLIRAELERQEQQARDTGQSAQEMSAWKNRWLTDLDELGL